MVAMFLAAAALPIALAGVALADFSAAVRLDPKYADPLYLRGLAKSRTGGESDIVAARKIKPDVGY
jgi:hypothetical protein